MVSQSTTYLCDGCRKVIATLRMSGSINMHQLAFETGLIITIPECIHTLKKHGLVGEKLIDGRRVFELYAMSHEPRAEVEYEAPIREI